MPKNFLTKRRSTGAFVVDAIGNSKPVAATRVKPSAFLDLVDRLDHTVIVHHKRISGMNSYFACTGGFVVETRTPRKLSLLDASEQVMEEPEHVSHEEPPVNAAPEQHESPESDASKPDEPDTTPRNGYAPSVQSNQQLATRKQPLMEYFTHEKFYVTEWWNNEEDPALSVARMRVEPGITTRPYRLHGITERYLFLSGRAIVEIDGVSREVGPGEGILIKSGAKRSVRNIGKRDVGLLAICRPRFNRLSVGEKGSVRFVQED